MKMNLSTEQQYRANKKGLGHIEAETLSEALSIAISFAGESNSENYNACALYIYEDGTFYIGERTYSNTSFSPTKSGRLNFVIMTVSAKGYPAQSVPFSVAHFCAHYGVKMYHNPPANNTLY